MGSLGVTKKRIWIGLGVVLVAALGLLGFVKYKNRGIVAVQTSPVLRQDITSIVTASGEIKPRNYINIGASAQGELVAILVKEGDKVSKGQLLARLENTQPQADLEAQRAAVSSADADAGAAEAGVKAAEETLRSQAATIDRSKSDLVKAKQDYERYEGLYKERLVAQQEVEARRAALTSAEASLREAEARLAQSRAQREQAAAQLAASQKRGAQARAGLERFSDILRKRNVYAPLDGVVTNLPVRVGETVVPGIQNSPASTIMTIADMSLITAEVKVDEADIVSVMLDQTAAVTIDAVPDQIFTGRVIEIGNTAIVRSTGVAASQSAISGQEAKDFKVVVALDHPPGYIRPGLSCTAKVTTATRQQALTIPVQALTVRERRDLEPHPTESNGVQASTDPLADKKLQERVQGVFVVSGDHATFHEVKTGISGSTDIEVLDGLQEKDQIVIGPYQVIRTLQNNAQVKVDNRPSQRG
jgi:HlyD family secretion protein